ncbi:MAG TPA: hypothetical protein PK307_00160 [Spirochaetota bacterium]|nr:hypothetical protein [Spirochaetota bacterium]HOD15763.1 hypothetical protein [Spirochaetota bacterium]HQL80582.1 hypothetical protein [Spirochaetota bacterium]
MHSCLLRRYLCVFTLLIAAMFVFAGCGKTSGGSSGLLALLGGGGPDVLQAPENVTASNGSFTDKVTVTWDAVAGATYYQVFRCDTEDGTYEQISGDETETTYDDTDITLLPNVDYYYKVRALNAETESELSDFAAGKLGLEPLDAPLNVTATDGTHTDKIVVSWDAVTNATYYRVYRSTAFDGTYDLISGDETAASYEDTAMTPARDYCYKVKAFNDDQESEYSEYSTGMAGLAAPLDVAASDATYKDHIAVTWSAVTGADYYRVYRSATSGGTYDLISGDETGTSYNDDDGSLVASTDYFYKVRAFYGTVESSLSAYDAGSMGAFVTPNPPVNVAATQGTYEDRVTITWNASEGADYYNVFRAETEGGAYDVQIGGDIAALTVDDDTGAVGTHYYYKVKAHNADGWSDFSLSAEGWSEEAIIPLDAPANVSASDRTSTATVTVSWDAVTDADYYRVYRALKTDGTYAQVGGDITDTSYGDTDTFEDLAYYYKVKAFDSVRGESAFSAIDSGQCELTPFEYLIRFNLDWDRMFRKLADRSDFPPSGAKSYTVNGATSGSTAVNVTVPGLNKAKTSFTHSSYNDYGMVFGGSESTDTNWSGTGTHSGTVTTSGTYTGSIGQNLTVTSKLRTAGTFTPSYGGSSDSVSWSSTRGVNGLLVPIPHHVSATQGSDAAKVVVTWAPVYAAPVYEVFRATSSGGSYTSIGTVTGSWYSAAGTVYTFDDSTAAAGTHYFYKVRVVNNEVINDKDGDQEHDADETAYSDYSSIAEGWR